MFQLRTRAQEEPMFFEKGFKGWAKIGRAWIWGKRQYEAVHSQRFFFLRISDVDRRFLRQCCCRIRWSLWSDNEPDPAIKQTDRC
jgi:hypothetical protein